MKWVIDKSFSFCYGHRVWSQQLNEEYALDSKLVCRHLHGHEGLVKVFLEGDELTHGMVTDFKHLNWFKKFLDDNLDHKFIMDIHDPILLHEFPLLLGNNNILNLKADNAYFQYPNLINIKSKIEDMGENENVTNAIMEKYEGAVFVDFVPTSENLCAWLMRIANDKMKRLGVKVSSVEFNETPKSHAKVIA